MTQETLRLQQAHEHTAHWRRWGPYLSERQWGTVREDYSPYGTAWDFFPHDHTRSRVYRWGEDGMAGICDNHQRLCFALALWNGQDPILKERLFGLTGSEGNHGKYAKATTDDILIRITASNRGPDAAELRLLPTLWFRNTWSWDHAGVPSGTVRQMHPAPGTRRFSRARSRTRT